MRLPVFRSLQGYQPAWLRGDLIAGFTVWAVLVPEALAYATIAGVSPVVGLYAAPGALLLYAMFGSSRHLVVGPMSATAALSAAAIAQLAAPGSDAFTQLTIALAIVTGIAAIVAGLLRLGFLASFISEPVLKGFIVGLALTIIAGQLPKLFGVEAASGEFLEKILGLIRDLGDTHVLTLVVGVVSLAIVLGLREVAPALPASLIAVLFGIGAVAILDLDAQGVAIVGPIPGGLPHLGLPQIALADWLLVVPNALGIMLVGFAEGLGAAKNYAAREHTEVDADRELIGLGAANLGAGLASGMVVNGSLSKSAVNVSAGARTQVSGLVVAAMTIVTLLFLTWLFEGLPEATLAAVVIAAVWELVDVRSLMRLYRLSTAPLARFTGLVARPDFLAALTALVGVLLFGTLPGLFLGIGISILLLLYRVSRPHVAILGQIPGTQDQFGDVARHPENQTTPGVTIVRVDGGILFVNADHVRDQVMAIATAPGAKAVVLDMETVAMIDVSGVRMLSELREQVEARGVRLLVARDVGQVRELVRRDQGDEALRDLHPTVAAAVAAAAAAESPG